MPIVLTFQAVPGDSRPPRWRTLTLVIVTAIFSLFSVTMSRLGFSISSNSEPPFIPALAALICLLLAVVLPISLRWRWRHPFELTLAFAVASVIVPIGNSLPLVALACLIGRRRGPAVWWTTALVGLTTTWVVIWDVTAQPIGASFWKMVFAPTTADSTRSDLTIGAGTAAAIIVTEFVLSVGVGLYVGHHREQQAKAAPLQTPQTAAWPAPPSAPPHTEAAKFTPPEQPHRRPVPATQVTNDWRPSQPPPQANSQADLAARHVSGSGSPGRCTTRWGIGCRYSACMPTL